MHHTFLIIILHLHMFDVYGHINLTVIDTNAIDHWRDFVLFLELVHKTLSSIKSDSIG